MEEIYFLLRSRGLFPEEKKGCHKGSGGTWSAYPQRKQDQSKKMKLWPGLTTKRHMV